MNDKIKTLRALTMRSMVHRVFRPRKPIRGEKYLCGNCKSMIPGSKTALRYEPVTARLCPYCGNPVIKVKSAEAKRFIKDLETEGYVAQGVENPPEPSFPNGKQQGKSAAMAN